MKKASEEADRRSGSREFYTEGIAVEKALDGKYEVTSGFENKEVMTGVVWPVGSRYLTAVQAGMAVVVSVWL